MVELKEQSAFSGLLPLTLGAMTLEAAEIGPLTSISSFGGAAPDLAKLQGIGWPAPGQSTQDGAARCIWFGRTEVLLVGAKPAAGLSDQAAVVDQSDAWAVAKLHGAGAVEVLARLVPVDLRAAKFAEGATARTSLGHMNASITRVADGFLIMVFRSMAETLVHDLKQAMAAVAARG